jgi:hypothetical protein
MNPSVNSGGPTFSACSIEQIQPVIDFTASRSNTCITEITLPTIEITSTAQTVARVGEAYQYDDDGKLDVVGNGPLTFTLDIAPDTMTIDDSGLVTWTPREEEIGTNFVQIMVSNDYTSAVHTFEIEVTRPEEQDEADFINFNTVEIQPYNVSQDESGTASIGENEYELVLEGNTWKKIDINYVVTPNTVIEFEFESNVEGEIHGIGLDNDNRISSESSFQVFGSQNWGISVSSYNANSGKSLISIPIGNFISGNFKNLVFINDNDANRVGVNSVFSNIRIYEESTSEEETDDIIDFYSVGLLRYQPGTQDMYGTASIIENGAGVELTGNKWQFSRVEGVEITMNTVLSFEFKSDSIGEVHGIGFLNRGTTENKIFRLHGTQNWGINDYK